MNPMMSHTESAASPATTQWRCGSLLYTKRGLIAMFALAAGIGLILFLACLRFVKFMERP